MTEFAYCPRAGLIQHEQQVDEDEVERVPRAQVHYRPSYELRAIERRIERIITEVQEIEALIAHKTKIMWKAMAVTAALGVGVGVAVYGAAGILGCALSLVAMVAVMAPVEQYSTRLPLLRKEWRWLQADRDKALATEPRIPKPTEQGSVAINWWEMINAGFESIVWQDKLTDHVLQVGGRPWRVLQMGSQRIPVFQKRSHSSGQQTLRGQHYARMEAYCTLLETCVGGESPFGVILFGDSYDGVAVMSHTRGSRAALQKALAVARHTIDLAERKVDPPPAEETQCRGCPYGKPFVHIPGRTDNKRFGAVLEPHTFEGNDGRQYHSACGDRFEWTPPHEKMWRKTEDAE